MPAPMPTETLRLQTPEQQALVAGNMRFAFDRVIDFLKSHPDLTRFRDDLDEAAIMGLFYAARGFKPELGYSFRTYAWRPILAQLRRAQEAIRHRKDRWGTSYPFSSGEYESMDFEHEMELPDGAPAIEPIQADSDLLERLLQVLPKRKADIIRDHFIAGLTIKEIATKHGVISQCISGIVAESLERMRTWAQRKGWQDVLTTTTPIDKAMRCGKCKKRRAERSLRRVGRGVVCVTCRKRAALAV